MSKLENAVIRGADIDMFFAEEFPFGVLTKLSDDKFEGNHPNGFNVGPTARGTVSQKPKVGISCVVGSIYTSTVSEIVSEEEGRIVFKTLNSTYELEY